MLTLEWFAAGMSSHVILKTSGCCICFTAVLTIEIPSSVNFLIMSFKQEVECKGFLAKMTLEGFLTGMASHVISKTSG